MTFPKLALRELSLTWITLAFLIFGQNLGFAQSTNPRIEELTELTRKYARYPDSLEYIGKQLITFNDSFAKSEGHFALGYSYYQKGQMDIAVLHYDTALTYTDPTKHYASFSRIKRNQAITLQRMGKLDLAKNIYLELLKTAEDDNNQREQALMFNQLGMLTQNAANYTESAEYFNKAIEIYRKADPSSEALTNAMLNLGTMYGRMNLVAESNKRLFMAAKNAAEYNQTTILARCYNNIAVNYRRAEKLDSSNYYLSICERIYKELNLTIDLIGTYQNKASNYLILENKDSAYFFLNKTLDMSDPKDAFRRGQLTFLAAQVELKFGSAEKAIELTNEAISQSLEHNRIDNLNDHYTLLSDAYEKNGNTTAALNIMKKWKNLKDSLDFYKSIETIQEITAKYDFARSTEILNESKAQTSFFQKLTTRLAIVLVVAIFISIYLYHRFNKKRIEAALATDEVEDLNQQIEELQNIKEKESKKFISLKSKAVIQLDDLMFVQSDGHYLEYYLDGKPKPEIDRGTLKDLLSDLPKHIFIQIHRSYVVNIRFVREAYSNKLVLINNQELNISRSFKSNIDSVLKNKT
jgi:tetratricopeptide (TPR) repeat protein